MKCKNCGTEFAEGIFCPECGTRCEDIANAEVERIARENAEVERQARENAEAERIVREKAEAERLAEENRKADVESRTIHGTVYETADEAQQAKREHDMIDVLKTRLLATKSQKERQKIFGNFKETIQNIDARKRYELLEEKVSRRKPLTETLNRIYGITVLITFFIAVIMSINEDDSILQWISFFWAGFGVWIWPIWKIVLVVKSKNENYYKNIKDI